MAQPHRGLLFQAGPFEAAPHPRLLQTRTQRTTDGVHRRHQSRASRSHLALQNRQFSMIRIGMLFWKHHTRQPSAEVSLAGRLMRWAGCSSLSSPIPKSPPIGLSSSAAPDTKTELGIQWHETMVSQAKNAINSSISLGPGGGDA